MFNLMGLSQKKKKKKLKWGAGVILLTHHVEVRVHLKSLKLPEMQLSQLRWISKSNQKRG